MPTTESPAPIDMLVSGAKSGLFGMTQLLQDLEQGTAVPRPSATLGIFSAVYLGQGLFLPASTAIQGVGMGLSLIDTQMTGERNETFALLQDYGSLLQVDVVDAMNRGTDRTATLDQYLDALDLMNGRIDAKIDELDAALEVLHDERQEARNVVREIERLIQQAYRDEQYEVAGSKERELADAQAGAAEAESRENQTDDILDRYKKMLKVGLKRAEAIRSNREILVAGLKVVDVPGIEEFELIIK